jgi:hypothetical protein
MACPKRFREKERSESIFKMPRYQRGVNGHNQIRKQGKRDMAVIGGTSCESLLENQVPRELAVSRDLWP